jgi:hypothetical protein
VRRQEAHGDAVAAGGRQLGVELVPVELVGDLDQQPRAVAGMRVRAGGPAVVEVLDRGDAALDDLVRGGAVQARDKRDAAGVVFEAGVVQASGLGQHRVQESGGLWRVGRP